MDEEEYFTVKRGPGLFRMAAKNIKMEKSQK